MSGNQAIGGIGMYPTLGYNDYQYLAAAMSTPNPNAISFKGASAAETTTTTTTQPQPTYVQTATTEKKKNSKAPWVLGGIAVLGAAACIYGYSKGNTDLKGLERIKDGLKTAWNSIRGKAGDAVTDAADKAKTVFPKANNVQEVTVMKDGMQFVMKDGKPVKIITQEHKVIESADEIAKWELGNNKIVNEIKSLNITGKLPKGVSLSYTKQISDGKNVYQMIVENGKVVKAFSKNKEGDFIEVAQNELEAFLRNHAKAANEATTLTGTLNGKTIRMFSNGGTLKEFRNKNVTISVKDGKVVKAIVGTKELSAEELKALQKDLSKEIAQFGKEAGSKYQGLTSYEYIYRQKGGQKIRFNGSKTITSVNSVEDKVLTTAEQIKQYLEKNSGIKTELSGIASGSVLPSGYRLGNVLLKSDSGKIYTVCGDKITLILNADGTQLTGDALKSWKTSAEGKNEMQRILQSLKA